MKAAIHQPQYIPWVPYFDKILQSDVFILLDNVQFQKNGLQNRNKIKGGQGAHWLTIPVQHHFGQFLCDTKIAGKKILKKHLKTFAANYGKALYYTEIMSLIEESFNTLSSDTLSDLCANLIMRILDYLNYKGTIVKSSELNTKGHAGKRLINICKELDAGVYLSGSGGHNYLYVDAFEKAGIQVEFQSYQNQIYPQCFPNLGFYPDLSVIDLLFNTGHQSLEIIEKGRL